SGPDWLFDIDALTRTMNYEPIVAGTQPNGFAGAKASNNADPKSSQDDGLKPSSDDGKKVDEDLRNKSECKDQEKEDNVNSTNNVNTVSSSVNTVGTNEVNAFGELLFDPGMPALEDVGTFDFLNKHKDCIASPNSCRDSRGVPYEIWTVECWWKSPPVIIHTWLERFNKQKPHSFERATAPVDAKNWISHMEKIFDVMGCEDAFKTRLAVYKFEDNALAWWKAYKQAKGGDAWLINVTWADFKKLFFLQFFPRAELERLKREYHSIRQMNTETSTEFMQRFLQLAGFLGAATGTEEEQAKNFQWGLRRSTLNHLMCISYTDVAQVANAARNYEILHKRDDDDTERPEKW
nr:zinc finger, CCHC-type, retrotransposon Gag domain protein [Tanacetum cinerariifolium]